MANDAQKQTTLFYSFAFKDEKYRAELETHLAVLENSGSISGWNCRNIDAGDDWRLRIDENLNSADIILLLISDNFLASKYCWTIEAKRALERSAAGEAVTIPVILTDCDWENTPLASLQALPDRGKPIT